MARSALSASRSIEVIELLNAFPDRAFTLAEIARATGINAASGHAVVSAPTERGYLLRTSSKAYQLGPALIATGIAAARSQPIIAHIDRFARLLLAEIRLPLLLTTIVDQKILALMTLGDDDGQPLGMHVGERLPLVAPVGAPFLSWADETARTAWLARRGVPLSTEHKAELRRDLALTRQNGFHVMLRSDHGPRIATLLADMATSESVEDYRHELRRTIDALDYLMCQPDELASDQSYDVMLIAAPIFDRTGQVAYNLCIGGMTQRISGDRVRDYADQLMRCCLDISRSDRS